MSKLEYSDYDALTVIELKDMADQLSVEIPSDARKAEIIEALQAASSSAEASDDKAESKNVYTYQTSSTTEATLDSEEFRKLKLTS